jgi:Bacterial protein of unknown function (DUF937)
MGLLDQVMSAIQDPAAQGSSDQFGQILSMAQQIASNNNTNSDSMQQTMSVVGGFVRSALQEKRGTQGEAAVQDLIRQGLSGQGGADLLSSLFSGTQQQEVVQAVSSRTGLDANQVMAMLPAVLPLVMQFLNQGSASGGAAPAGSGNSLLNAFLDGDKDGDLDLGDIMNIAGKFM